MEEAEKTQNQYNLQEGVAMLHAVHTRRHHQKARKHGMAASGQSRVDDFRHACHLLFPLSICVAPYHLQIEAGQQTVAAPTGPRGAICSCCRLPATTQVDTTMLCLRQSSIWFMLTFSGKSLLQRAPGILSRN